MLVSAVQQHESAVCVHISLTLALPSCLPYPTLLGHLKAQNSSLCNIAASH